MHEENDYIVRDAEPTLGDKIKDGFRRGKDWAYRNSDVLIACIPMVLGAGAVISKTVGRGLNLRKQEKIKNLYCYDNQLGHYWQLKKKLTNNQWMTIERRKQAGEKLGEILADMDVLK